MQITIWRFAGITRCEPDLRRVTDKAGRSICEVAVREPRIAEMALQSERHNGEKSQLIIYVAAQKEASPRGSVTVTVVPGPLFLQPIYPAVNEPKMLAEGSGSVDITLGIEDNPFYGQQHYVQGRTKMLLGIASNGQIKTCRPLISAGVAWLDNLTCENLARRGRYRFKDPSAARYQGLRYIIQSVVWKDPL